MQTTFFIIHDFLHNGGALAGTSSKGFAFRFACSFCS